jgi:hypothetical protein
VAEWPVLTPGAKEGTAACCSLKNCSYPVSDLRDKHPPGATYLVGNEGASSGGGRVLRVLDRGQHCLGRVRRHKELRELTMVPNGGGTA